MFESPKKNQFTQGTIFSCAFADNYPGTSVYGLVITARCDAAQKKVPIYSFIPVVPIRDWILNDGAEIALRRQMQDSLNTLENILDDFEVSTSLLRTASHSDIAEKSLKPIAATDRKAANRVQKFIDAYQFIERIEAVLAKGTKEDVKSILAKTGKAVDQLLKELAGNRLLGYYLLRGMPTLYDPKPCDFVALLREVHHIPNRLALRITNGISANDWSANSIAGSRCPLFSESDDYCTPTAKLQSPWIEHLMQSWSMLFTRIGVEDIDVISVKKSLEGLGLEAA